MQLDWDPRTKLRWVTSQPARGPLDSTGSGPDKVGGNGSYPSFERGIAQASAIDLGREWQTRTPTARMLQRPSGD